jgi:hypothetical protein
MKVMISFTPLPLYPSRKQPPVLSVRKRERRIVEE